MRHDGPVRTHWSPNFQASPWLHTAALWIFAGLRIPLLFWVRPRVVEVSAGRVLVKIRLRRRTKNHLGTMYFGALATGADAAIGYLAMLHIRASGAPISLVFRDIRGDFLKGARGDAVFECEDGHAIETLVAEASASRRRCELACTAVARVAAEDGGSDEVARFVLTLSLRRTDRG
jgi:acyl-coenzyme A thioesterase PaaI-like protein